jgi:crotonobetainyl-CoA:carnitine CoA-transferase CaiB-like acyl-CoA transferase
MPDHKPADDDKGPPPGSLDGIRVVDLSRYIAGPYCAMLLGDMGADVVKVERPGRGDDLRALRGSPQGMSAAFAATNRNKRGIAVDLQHPEGARLVFELARRADVVIENFRPGVAGRLGLGHEAVRAANPSVVYASITGFGQTGPYAKRPGYNTIAQGMSGVMAMTGMPGHPPTRPGGSLADLAACYVAFGSINAALVQRFRTGRGQYLDVNLLASMMAQLPDPVALYLETGVRPGRHGNRNPNLTPAEAFQVAALFKAYLAKRGVSLGAPQETKTKAALDFYKAKVKSDMGGGVPATMR